MATLAIKMAPDLSDNSKETQRCLGSISLSTGLKAPYEKQIDEHQCSQVSEKNETAWQVRHAQRISSANILGVACYLPREELRTESLACLKISGRK